ncbi:MAG: aminopeptidase N [Pseudomonadota bacterium]
MKESTARTIHRGEYRVPEFLVDDVDLRFAIDADRTIVHARLALRRNPDAERADGPLVLDGQDLETLAVRVDGVDVPPERRTEAGEHLTLEDVPAAFVLETEVAISPAANTALEGLYVSGPFLLTQCEAEGFRKITWMLDRPDVMARYRVRLEADRARYPVLLSNGNRVEAGDLADGRHFATWEDPFPKPTYLFAIVAGELECIEDRFRTRGGRDVALLIYAEKENLGRLDHAMESLKASMAWDESRFGLEYDLDVYHIVATNDFNMGAMENKSLNIFNAKYVLASPDSATDHDYLGIEAVIGHEYFHNWTGNRVTCRDWFQLSLKEGLTVFRDQEFTADLQSRAVKRIEDVRLLRSAQFSEDAGPMAHSVRPESYIEINNFYTLTVYEKGAEVVRMYHTLLGEDGFQRGMKLYFERHDGQAVTCDDFRGAMADANDIDLDQFERWYLQAGTPMVTVTDAWDEAAGRYELTFRQETAPTTGQPEKLPLHVPVAVGLVGPDGTDQPLRPVGRALGGAGDVIELREAEESVVFEGLDARPVPSLLRRFSAPVRLAFPYDRDQLAFLMAHDGDSFNRWDAAQRLATDVILECVAAIQAGGEPQIDERLPEAAAALLADEGTDPALIAEAIGLPDVDTLLQQLDVMDVASVLAARRRALRAVARRCEDGLRDRFDALRVEGSYRPAGEDGARRSLRNTALGYLGVLGNEAVGPLAQVQFRSANNMTDRFAALRVLLHEGLDGAEDALEAFHDRHRDDALVLDKWFAVQGSIPRDGVLTRVHDLLAHPAFSMRNPNKVRSLIGAFARNHTGFHAADGSGYRFLAEQVRTLDALNPQIAARLVSIFNAWRRMPASLGEQIQGELEGLRSGGSLSPDVFEIVTKALAEEPK